jgi:hypothetical protein
VQLAQQRLGVGVRAGGLRRHAGATQQGQHLVVAQLGQQRLPDAGAVRRDAPAHLGEHPHRVGRGDVGDVDDRVALEDRHVGRLADLRHQLV